MNDTHKLCTECANIRRSVQDEITALQTSRGEGLRREESLRAEVKRLGKKLTAGPMCEFLFRSDKNPRIACRAYKGETELRAKLAAVEAALIDARDTLQTILEDTPEDDTDALDLLERLRAAVAHSSSEAAPGGE